MSAKVIIRKYFESELVIDDQAIAVKVRRMTNREFDAFQREFAKHGVTRGPAEPETPGAQEAREEAARTWMRTALEDNLVIVPGQIQDEEGRDVKSGELLDLYGGRVEVVPQALAVIFVENHVTESKKKAFRQQLVSSLGSVALLKLVAAFGPEPEKTVAPAASSDSASSAGAEASPSDASSGGTDPILDAEAPACV